MAVFMKTSRAAEITLTSLFFLEVLAAFLLLPQRLPRGCPLGPLEAAGVLAACCALLLPMISVVKRVSGASAAWFSRSFMKADPLAKHRSRSKFEDQSWQLWIHATMTALECYVLFIDGGGEPWFDEPSTLWIPHPRLQVHDKTSVHVLYVIQMAIWIVTAFSHQFFEERHKDYAMMWVHHLVTIALIGLSYTMGYVRIGVLVLLMHDSSDIVIDLLKTTNYMKLEGLSHLFLVELCFVTNLFTWGYSRLYLYGYHVVYMGGWVAPREVLLSPGSPGIGWAKAVTRGHAPGFSYPKSIGDGSFSLLENIKALPTHEEIPGYWSFNLLMSSLIIMHVIWYLMFWRMFYRLLTKEAAHEAGREEYEGGSDDD